MKQVYQCDFCTTTNANMEKILEHEQQCRYDPARKTCASCKHNHSFFDSDSSGCQIKVPNSFDIGEDDLQCDKWEIDAQRKIEAVVENCEQMESKLVS